MQDAEVNKVTVYLLKALRRWVQRDKRLQEKVTFMDKKKVAALELFRSRIHFGELKQPKTLLIIHNQQLYILKRVENQYVCHDLSV